MSETADFSRESLERAHEAHAAQEAHQSPRDMRRVAVLISILAAGLALCEMGEKASQNEYLTHHVALSDTYAYYQSRTVRGDMFAMEADLLASLPGAASDPATQQKIAAAKAQAARMNDDPTVGRKKLLEKANVQTADRDHAFHLYHEYELMVGALQIAIVLASVSVVTRIRMLTIAAAGLGGIALAFGLLVVAGAA